MSKDELVKLLRLEGYMTYADRKEAAALIEQQAAKIAELADDLERTRHERNFSHVQARREISKEYRGRIAELRAERDAMMSALAECRDAMPIPEAGAELEGHWVSAMADPLEVPGFIKAHMAATVAPAVDAQPVGEIAHNEIDGFHFAPSVHWLKIGIGTKLYDTPPSEGLRKDAQRYRWLRDTLHGAKAGGGVEVNDALQVYQQPVQGEEVRIYWYLHTPIGFHEITAATIDDAIDEGMAGKDPQ